MNGARAVTTGPDETASIQRGGLGGAEAKIVRNGAIFRFIVPCHRVVSTLSDRPVGRPKLLPRIGYFHEILYKNERPDRGVQGVAAEGPVAWREDPN